MLQIGAFMRAVGGSSGIRWVVCVILLSGCLGQSCAPVSVKDDQVAGYHPDPPPVDDLTPNSGSGTTSTGDSGQLSPAVPEVVILASSQEGIAPLKVDFNAAGPEGGSRPAGTYRWAFGDGSASTTGVPVSHTFAAAGQYRVQLVVSVKAGETTLEGRDEILVVVNEPVNQTPTALDTSAETDEAAAVTLTLTGADPEDASLTFQISSMPEHGTLGALKWASATVARVIYTPASGFSGVDTFSFTVSDGENESVPATAVVYVNPSPPPAAAAIGIRVTAQEGTVPLRIAFTATGVDGQSRPRGTYHWDFGDGTPEQTGAVVAHTFSEPGSYAVSLCAYGGTDGAEVLACAETTIVGTQDSGEVDPGEEEEPAPEDIVLPEDPDPAPAVAIGIAATKNEGTAPLRIAFTATGVDGEPRPLGTYVWNFGYDTPEQTGAVVAHTFRQVGSYLVTLSVVDRDDEALVLARTEMGVTVQGPANTAPVVSKVAAQTAKNQAVTLTLSGQDADGDALVFSIVSSPAHGSLGSVTKTTATAATVAYTPTDDFTGSDTFTYRASDGVSESAVGTATITVIESATVVQVVSFEQLVQCGRDTALQRDVSWEIVLTADITWPYRYGPPGIRFHGSSVSIRGNGHTLDMTAQDFQLGVTGKEHRTAGIEFWSQKAYADDLRIVGFDGGGSAIKCYIDGSLELRRVSFVDVGSTVHPFFAPEPVATADDCWFSQPVGGSAQFATLIDCTWENCSTNSFYSHCVYLTGQEMLMRGCRTIRSGHPVKFLAAGDSAKRVVTLVDNDFEVVPVPFRTSEKKLPSLLLPYQPTVVLRNVFRWPAGDWHIAPVSDRAPNQIAASRFEHNVYVGPCSAETWWNAPASGSWISLSNWQTGIEPSGEWRLP